MFRNIMTIVNFILLIYYILLESKNYDIQMENQNELKKIEAKVKSKQKEKIILNTIERLLKLDAGKIKTPEKEVKMKLKKIGEEFTFPCKAVDPEYIAELQENSIEFREGDIDKIKMYDTKVMTIVEGCPSIFKNMEIVKHFGCATPKDLVKKLLVSGEMDDLKGEIDKLGGYDKKKGKKEEEDIKN